MYLTILTYEEEKWVLENNKRLFKTQLGDEHLYLFVFIIFTATH